MKKWVLILFLSGRVCAAYGQQMSDAYYRDNPAADPTAFPETDSVLFYIPAGAGSSVFDRLSAYAFGFVSYDRRGAGRGEEALALYGMPLFAAPDGRTDYSLLGAVRIGRFAFRKRWPGGSEGGFAAAFGRETVSYEMAAGSWPQGITAAFGFSGRGYGFRASASVSGVSERGWHYSFACERRWGRDCYADGVFTDASAAAVSFGKRFRSGGFLTASFIAAPSLRGLRAWTTEEVFRLAGDNMYNPAWGRWDGKKRNPRTARSFTPLAAVSYAFDAGAAGRITVSGAFSAGTRSLSALAWYDAENPYPDYYTRLPGYFTDPDVARYVTELWNGGDGHAAHIDWDRIRETNAYSASGAVYVLASRVERPAELHFAARGEVRSSERLTVTYGVGFDGCRSEVFRRADDLLGGSPFLNCDRYLVGDEVWGESTENDLRNPGRRVGEGERFGFDCRMTFLEGRVHAGADYETGRFRVSAAGCLSRSIYRRRGMYEKQTLPGEASFGNSPSATFPGWTAALSAGYSFSARAHASAYVSYEGAAPTVRNAFLLPDYANVPAEAARSARILRAGANVGLDFRTVRIDASAYLYRTDGECRAYRYYDDLFSEYSVMYLSGISRLCYGLEAGAEADLSPRFTVSAAAAFGHYSYDSDPVADIFSGVDLRPLLAGTKSMLKGYVCSASPQTAVCAAVSFRHPSGWRISAKWAYVAGRYAEPEPLRRTPRAFSLASADEQRARFTEQERLPDASSLGIFVSKRFRTRMGDFTASVSADNVLGDRGTVYGAREQMRIRHTRSGAADAYAPFPSRRLYAYPLVVRAALNYVF